jgi:flavin-dependent dehydrogenase
LAGPDVVIVGGGPAGACAGLVLARAGARVTILDRATFPRDKLCGDTVNPGALGRLRALGVAADVEARGLRVDGMLLTGERGVAVEGRYPDGVCGRAILRRDLDWILLQHAIAAGCQVEQGVAARGAIVGESAGMPRVIGVTVGGRARDISLSAPIVITADGRHSTLAFGLGLARHPDRPRRWAIGAYFEDFACTGCTSDVDPVSAGWPSNRDRVSTTCPPDGDPLITRSRSDGDQVSGGSAAGGDRVAIRWASGGDQVRIPGNAQAIPRKCRDDARAMGRESPGDREATPRQSATPTARQVATLGEMHVRRGRYIGVAPVPGGLTNVCVVRASGPGDPELADPRALLTRELARDPVLRARAADARLVTAPVVLGPLAVDGVPAAIDGLLVAGDAAGFIDPMTGDGIRFAVRGAELAAAAALDALAHGWSGVHARLAAARAREFGGKWRFNRALRALVASPRAVAAATLGARVAPAVFRALIAHAGDCDALIGRV